jgi:hypothetical protein
MLPRIAKDLHFMSVGESPQEDNLLTCPSSSISYPPRVLPKMPMPDADIHPHATGKAEATVKAHSKKVGEDGVNFYAGW